MDFNILGYFLIVTTIKQTYLFFMYLLKLTCNNNLINIYFYISIKYNNNKII